jgi:pimeloyl-ACP methyl ester carboxylesterase
MRSVLLGVFLVGLVAPSAWTQTKPSIQFVTVDQDVRLEVVDWGGRGNTLLFLSGMGNTAHVYDTFAPEFTNGFHVIGVTRRGFGASSRPQRGYTVPRLADDIIAVIDRLRLDRPILVGHSIAGEELSYIASHTPDHIGGLIYFDAAYDRADPTFAAVLKSWPGQAPAPSAADDASRAAYQAFFQRTHRFHYPETELDQYERFGDGAPDVPTTIMAGVLHPEYGKITAPALAFYSMPTSVRELFPAYDDADAGLRIAMDGFWPRYAVAVREQHRRFVEEVRGPQVTAIDVAGATHYLFLDSNANNVASRMREFLSRSGATTGR